MFDNNFFDKNYKALILTKFYTGHADGIRIMLLKYNYYPLIKQ